MRTYKISIRASLFAKRGHPNGMGVLVVTVKARSQRLAFMEAVAQGKAAGYTAFTLARV